MPRNTEDKAAEKRIIPEFTDEHIGLPVILMDSVYEATSGNAPGVIIPDIPGLEAAIAMARVMDDFKLSGGELKFLRRAIGIKAVELAKFLDVTPETVSRWETGREPISTNAERILRLQTYNALREKASGVEANLDDILTMRFRALRIAGEGVMVFKRVIAVRNHKPEYIWLYLGENP